MAKKENTKKEKTKKIKVEKYRSDEQMEMIRFIRILIIVVILIVAVYFFTRIFATKDLLNNNEDETPIVEGTVNYNITMIGSMLNKPEEEYYVMIYNTENLRSIYYSGLMTVYTQNEEPLKIYFADLNKELNQKFYNPENVNLEVNNISDLRVGDLTLIKVRNGNIDEVFTEEEDIASELEYVESEDTVN